MYNIKESNWIDKMELLNQKVIYVINNVFIGYSHISHSIALHSNQIGGGKFCESKYHISLETFHEAGKQYSFARFEYWSEYYIFKSAFEINVAQFVCETF